MNTEILIAFVGFSVLSFVLWKVLQKGTGSNADGLLRSGILAVQQRKFVEGQLDLEPALKILNSESRPDIPKIVSCLANLGQCYENMGDHQAARDAFSQVTKNWETYVQRKDAQLADIDYAALNSDFGSGTQDICDFYMQIMIPFREQTLGARHPDTLASYKITAHLLAKLGRTSEAEQFELKGKR